MGDSSGSEVRATPAERPVPVTTPAAEPMIFDLSNDSDDDEPGSADTATASATVAGGGSETGTGAGGVMGWGANAVARRNDVNVSSGGGSGGGSSGGSGSGGGSGSAPSSRDGQQPSGVDAVRFLEASGCKVLRSAVVEPQTPSRRSNTVSAWIPCPGTTSTADDSAGRGGGEVSSADGGSSSSSRFGREGNGGGEKSVGTGLDHIESVSSSRQGSLPNVRGPRSEDSALGRGNSRSDRAIGHSGCGGDGGVGWLAACDAGGRERVERDGVDVGTSRSQHGASAAPPSLPPWGESLVTYSTGHAHKSSVARGGGDGSSHGGVSDAGRPSRYPSDLLRRTLPSESSSTSSAARRDIPRESSSSGSSARIGSGGSLSERHGRRTPPPLARSSTFDAGGGAGSSAGVGGRGFRPSSASSHSHSGAQSSPILSGSASARGSSGRSGGGNNGGATIKDVSDAWATLPRAGVSAGEALVMGWDSAGAGSSLKRPRGSNHSHDYQVQAREGGKLPAPC